MSIDTTRLIAAFTDFVNELAGNEITPLPQPTPAPQPRPWVNPDAPPPDPIPSIDDDIPGNQFTGAGDRTLPIITEIIRTGKERIRISTQGLRRGMNCAVIRPGGQSMGYSLEVGDGWGVATGVNLEDPGMYSVRTINPRTYATSEWFTFTI